MRVDWVILADAAEVVNNKLYLMGGGWEVLTLGGSTPAVHPVAVAVSISVEWTETNERYPLEILVTDEDSRDVLASISGEFEVGRPPGIPPGQGQRVQIAGTLPISFPQTGGYVAIARVKGEDMGRAAFRVQSRGG